MNSCGISYPITGVCSSCHLCEQRTNYGYLYRNSKQSIRYKCSFQAQDLHAIQIHSFPPNLPRSSLSFAIRHFSIRYHVVIPDGFAAFRCSDISARVSHDRAQWFEIIPLLLGWINRTLVIAGSRWLLARRSFFSSEKFQWESGTRQDVSWREIDSLWADQLECTWDLETTFTFLGPVYRYFKDCKVGLNLAVRFQNHGFGH